ncbi:MAG: ribosomal-processing cysteine protease Prp [Clostridiales bacterium]|nr:MAG: ribosomal-processing cysteine protease Prp [Clostridiales bacterium]
MTDTLFFSNENDIVCSALSAVSYLTANGIEKCCKS